jgi:EmrB/QacA subfamily drug resistance transporter
MHTSESPRSLRPAHDEWAAHPRPSDADSASEQRTSWAVLALALVAQVLVVLDISVVNTALPTIGDALRLSSSDLQWLVTAYLLISGGGLLLGGRIADLLPRRRVFITGMAIFTTSSLLSGLASTASALIGARAGQGLGAALMTPAALSLIMTTYSGAQRARGLALWGAVGGLGIAAGVMVGGALTTWAGWQAIFWVNVPIGVVALAFALRILPPEATDRARLASFDVPGAVTVVAGLAALMFGVAGTTTAGWASTRTIASLLVSGSLLAAFVAIERRMPRPLVPPHTWSVKSLVAGTAVMSGVTGLLVGAVFLSSIFMQTVLGYSAIQAGTAFLPLALALVVGTHVAGHVMGHASPRHLAVAGLLTTAVGATMLSTASSTASYAANLLPGLMVVGVGTGAVFVAVSASAMAGVPAQHAGMASGFLMTGHEVGAALGVAVLSAVASSAGSFTTVHGASAAFSRGFVAAAVLAALVALFALLRMPATRTTGGVANMHMH